MWITATSSLISTLAAKQRNAARKYCCFPYTSARRHEHCQGLSATWRRGRPVASCRTLTPTGFLKGSTSDRALYDDGDSFNLFKFSPRAYFGNQRRSAMAAAFPAQRVCFAPSLPSLSGVAQKEHNLLRRTGRRTFFDFPPCFRDRCPHPQIGFRSSTRHSSNFEAPLLHESRFCSQEALSTQESKQRQVYGCKAADRRWCLSQRRAWARRRQTRHRLDVIVHAFPPTRDEEAGKDPQKFLVELERAWHISKVKCLKTLKLIRSECFSAHVGWFSLGCPN